MQHHLLKLLAPRATFPADMTPEEGAAMQAHFAYWGDLVARGTAHAVGPVLDPAGVWGLAVVTVADDAALEAVVAGDPIVKADLGFRYERVMMPQLAAPGLLAPAS